MQMHRAGFFAFLLVMLSFAASGWSQTSSSAFQTAQVQQKRTPPGIKTPTAATEGEADIRNRANNWTVTLLGGFMSGVHIKMATDIETVLNDGENLRILPIVSHGAKQNVLDLLYLKGADIAFTHADVFEELKKDNTIKNIDRRIQYISQGHVSAINVLARPEIKTLKDLQGKKVGFHGEGTGVAVTAPIVFGRLGIKVEPVYINNALALEKMKTGEIAALVHLLPRASEFLAKVPSETGFHLLNVDYDDRFTDYYLPYTIEQADYPNIIQPGETVETIGVSAVLAVYNWPKETDRYRRVERFVQYYFSRVDRLKKPPFQPEWKNVNLAAKVPGWTRYVAAEEALAKLAKNDLRSGTGNSIGAGGGKAEVPADIADDPKQRKLFDEFLEWKKQKAKP